VTSKQYRPDVTLLAANDPLLPLSVHGAGFIGLVTAACFAELGHVVLCADTDVARVAQLARGHLPFVEPGLEDLFVRNSRRGRLRFTNDVDAAVAHGAVQFVAVDTPVQRDGATDLRPLLEAARRIGAVLQRETLLVCRGAVPVGTAQQLRQVVQGELARRGLRDLRFAVASNPAFLDAGTAVERFMQPERVVVGADDASSIDALHALYAPLLRRPEQWLALAPRSAELASYACVAMQAARVGVMNELAQLAEALQIDVEEVRGAMAADARVGTPPAPNCGLGGAAVPQALRGLQRIAQDHGVALPIAAAAEQANQRQKGLLARRAIEWFGGSLAGRRVALWGLAVAAGSDELREAPSEMLIAMLLSAGARVVAHDPAAMPAARRQHGQLRGLSFAIDPLDAVEQADALLIATDWPEYRHVDWATVRTRMATPVVLDGRNLGDPAQLAALGFSYRGVGRNHFEKFAAIPAVAAIRARESGVRGALPATPAGVINMGSRA
jgi:UDPglucose 6-dehydrogenase